MATPLTDSINALTTYANEVTGASDTTLSDAVHTLANGYGGGSTNYLDSATRLSNIYNGAKNMPSKVEFSPIQLDSGENNNAYFMNRAYESGYNTPTIDVIIHISQETEFSIKNMFYQAYGIKTVAITGDLSHVTSYQYSFDYPGAFDEINLLFDFTSCTTANSVKVVSNGYNTKVTKLRFVPNTLAFSCSYKPFQALDADTLISLANCLRADVTGQTLTLYSIQLSLCSTLMGNNDNGTFVSDENGTMSLADFIANVKGWTLA